MRVRIGLLAFAVSGVPGAALGQATESLSEFRRAKAEWLLEQRLPCLGCHRLDERGGRIGPDLSNVGARRSPAFIRATLVDPQGVQPNGIMPGEPLPPQTLALLVEYLAARGGPIAESADDLAREGTDAAPGRRSRAPAAAYAQWCAACHGAEGRGDGPNAQYLPARPTAHADSGYMATRSDDVLFDAISAGGYVMNRSNRMPAFGRTLTPETIRGLVRYLRDLCRCEGPPWSRDGRR